MATTFVKIASVTVTGATAANLEFTSIPQNYTDLKIVSSARTNEAATQTPVSIYLNNDNTAANYTYRRLYGLGSSAGSDNSTTPTGGYVAGGSSTASIFGNLEFYVPNYNLSNNKSISSDGVGENNATGSGLAITAILWNNTSAITSIKIIPNGGSFVQYSTATLYGIKSS